MNLATINKSAGIVLIFLGGLITESCMRKCLFLFNLGLQTKRLHCFVLSLFLTTRGFKSAKINYSCRVYLMFLTTYMQQRILKYSSNYVNEANQLRQINLLLNYTRHTVWYQSTRLCSPYITAYRRTQRKHIAQHGVHMAISHTVVGQLPRVVALPKIQSVSQST